MTLLPEQHILSISHTRLCRLPQLVTASEPSTIYTAATVLDSVQHGGPPYMHTLGAVTVIQRAATSGPETRPLPQPEAGASRPRNHSKSSMYHPPTRRLSHRLRGGRNRAWRRRAVLLLGRGSTCGQLPSCIAIHILRPEMPRIRINLASSYSELSRPGNGQAAAAGLPSSTRSRSDVMNNCSRGWVVIIRVRQPPSRCGPWQPPRSHARVLLSET